MVDADELRDAQRWGITKNYYSFRWMLDRRRRLIRIWGQGLRDETSVRRRCDVGRAAVARRLRRLSPLFVARLCVAQATTKEHSAGLRWKAQNQCL
jgi:hypothetical protein